MRYKSKKGSKGNQENSHPNATIPKNKKESKKQKITEPIKILDAPGLEDDFYLNLLDWNSENFVAIALSPEIYIQNVQSGEIESLQSTKGEDGENTTSLSWAKQDCRPYLGQGLRSSEIRIWDTETSTVVNTIN